MAPRPSFLATAVILGTFLLGTGVVQAQELRALSLEDLMRVEVTSVSRRTESRFTAAAAVHVLTGEQIRRSGVRSLPEALRLAPGVEVARIDASKWAVTIRGFNGRFANKLLVMIDGRTLYTPGFSGVFWDVQQVSIDDIERIEVIRGPGSTLWGANAVNGVINVITRHASETEGGSAEIAGGNERPLAGSLRYGGSAGEGLWYRTYVSYLNRDAYVDSEGEPTADDWRMLHGGGRIDWEASERDRVLITGSFHSGEAGQAVLDPLTQRFLPAEADLAGGNVLMDWRHTFSPRSEIGVKSYVDITSRDGVIEAEDRRTFDLGFQHAWVPRARHQVIWGAGYRISDETGLSPEVFPDGGRTIERFSAFAQDEIAVIRDRLSLIVGTKLEHDEFSGFEIQPNLRASWQPREDHVVWAAVSRAVRTASLAEIDLQDLVVGTTSLPVVALPAVVTLSGAGELEAEDLTAWELGYRVQPLPWFSLDLAAFHHRYDDLVGTRVGEPFADLGAVPIRPVVPVFTSNNQTGESWGGELVANFDPRERLSISTIYSYLDLDVQPVSPTFGDVGGLSPRHQVKILTGIDPREDVDVDVGLHYRDELPALALDDHVRLDVRGAWRPTSGLEIGVTLRDLLEDEHREFGPSAVLEQATFVQRSFLVTLGWSF